MPRRLQKVWLLFAVTCIAVADSAWAQVLPVTDSFRDRTFDGPLDVAGPVQFDRCTFRTDSVVLAHSFGALFRNCVFESRSGVLCMAGSGDGMIMADCELNGCTRFRFSPDAYSRNYVSSVAIDGTEYVVPDEDESVIDMDGLALRDIVDGTAKGPLFIRIDADKKTAAPGDTVTLRLTGVDDDAFAGWRSLMPQAGISVDGPLCCRLFIPDGPKEVAVCAYTEYGLEAVCMIGVEYPVISVEHHGWLWRLFHRKKKR